MDTNVAISETTYAAIRFYSDEGRKVQIVSVKDIENFNGENCANEPYYVKKYTDSQKNNFHLSPAEVLSIGSCNDAPPINICIVPDLISSRMPPRRTPAGR